jgi:hypothetical protein
VLYCLCKNVPRFVEIIAGIKQAIDFRVIFGPLLDLVKNCGRPHTAGRRFPRRTNHSRASNQEAAIDLPIIQQLLRNCRKFRKILENLI